VVLDGGGQGGLVVDLADPAGQLRVPHKGVAADGLVVLLGPVDEVVGAAPRVGALLALQALPLHAVLGRDLAEVGLEDGRVLARRQETLVSAGTVVELALGLDERVDALRGLARLVGGGRHGAERRQEGNKTGLHGDGRGLIWTSSTGEMLRRRGRTADLRRRKGTRRCCINTAPLPSTALSSRPGTGKRSNRSTAGPISIALNLNVSASAERGSKGSVYRSSRGDGAFCHEPSCGLSPLFLVVPRRRLGRTTILEDPGKLGPSRRRQCKCSAWHALHLRGPAVASNMKGSLTGQRDLLQLFAISRRLRFG